MHILNEIAPHLLVLVDDCFVIVSELSPTLGRPIQGSLDVQDVLLQFEIEGVLSAFAFSNELIQDVCLVLSDRFLVNYAQSPEYFQILLPVLGFGVCKLLVEVLNEPVGYKVLNDEVVSF